MLINILIIRHLFNCGWSGWFRKSYHRVVLEHGVNHIVLVGLRPNNQQIQDYCQNLVEHYAAKIAYFSVDMTEESEVSMLAQMLSQWPHVKGVIDAVGVLQDGVLFQQNW